MVKAKVGVSLYCYHIDLMKGKMTVKDCIDHAADLGVFGIEIVDKQHIPNYPYPSLYDLLELRDYVESYGMVISCYSTYIDVMVRTNEWLSLEGQIKMLLNDIVEANILGAKVLRATPPTRFGAHTAEGERFESYKEYIEDVVGISKRVLPYLKKYDVRLGLEIHEPRPPEVNLSIVKQVNDEYVGLVPDFSVWDTATGKQPLEKLRDCLPYTVHVHAKAHRFDEKGEEPTIPFNKLIPIIRESNFSRFISAEFEGWGDSRENTKKLIELIRRYL